MRMRNWIECLRAGRSRRPTRRAVLEQLEVRAMLSGAVYTTDANFDLGVLNSVNHDAPNNNQLQLNSTVTPLPFFWVPNHDETVSKIDVNTGKELGRYRTTRPGVDAEPSRTTVDLEGNCWVANRYAGSAVKIALDPLDGVDRNGNGVIDTSTDLNNDGYITGGEILPWGQDEMVLVELVLIPADGVEAAFVPGTYAGGYRNDWTYPGLRSVAVDKNNDLWIGGLGSDRFYHIDGDSFAIIQKIDVPGHNAYGGLIDKNGILWSSGFDARHVLWMDTNKNPVTAADWGFLNVGHTTYGMAVDQNDHLFVNGWDSNWFTRININTKSIELQVNNGWFNQGRGVAVTPDGIVWVVSTGNNRVYRVDPNTLSILTHITGFAAPNGVAVDTNGKIWVSNDGSENVTRVSTAAPYSIELNHQVIGSGGHYSYSDMTGAQILNSTSPRGSWTVTQDAGYASAAWKTIAWNAEPEGTVPAGASLTVEARAANTVAGLAGVAYVAVPNGGVLPALNGQFIQVRANFVSNPATLASPVLSDIKIATAAPQLLSIVVNDGAAQRSKVNSLTVTFDQPVSLSAGAFSLIKRANPSVPGGMAVPMTIAPVSGFSSSFVVRFSGAGIVGGSLADGVYDFAVNKDLVADNIGQTAVNGGALTFHRLFGDGDGDKDVDSADLYLFRPANNTTQSSAGYRWYFDYDDDPLDAASGKIDTFDLGEVRKRMMKKFYYA